SNIFDNRLYYVQTTVGVTYRQNARLSYVLSGDGFTVHRTSRNLVGVNGYRATAQVNYRFTRRDHLGIGYTFTHFSYPRAFGASDLHGVSATYGRRLAPGLDVSF